MKADSAKGKVLVTGINGYVGAHIAKLLLERGYLVRGTVRDKNNKEKLSSLNELPSPQNLELYEANLLDPVSIGKAVEGCEYVMHVAAPIAVVGDESTTVKPAVEGTKSVLEAAIKHKVKAVIMTSSLLAVINHDVSGKVLDEEDWPSLDQPQPPYIKAKILSEKAAWEIYNKTPKESRPRLIAINPSYILGPTMSKTAFYSGEFVIGLMAGKVKGLPKLFSGIVDVRDVALAHIKALEKPEFDGQRYACYSGECLWMEDVAKILKEEFGKYGYDIATMVPDECPDKNPNSMLNQIWGKTFKMTNAKIKKDLGMEFITAKQTVIDMGYNLIKQGLVPDLIKK